MDWKAIWDAINLWESVALGVFVLGVLVYCYILGNSWAEGTPEWYKAVYRAAMRGEIPENTDRLVNFWPEFAEGEEPKTRKQAEAKLQEWINDVQTGRQRERNFEIGMRQAEEIRLWLEKRSGKKWVIAQDETYRLVEDDPDGEDLVGDIEDDPTYRFPWECGHGPCSEAGPWMQRVADGDADPDDLQPCAACERWAVMV